VPFLKYTDPEGASQTVELGADELLLGRDTAVCQVVLGKRYASRKHARLFKRGGNWVIADLGSSHGTFVNRLRITGEIELHAGDEIVIGGEVLSFVDRSEGRPTDSDTGEKRAEILAEKAIDGGDLLRTMQSARLMDLASLGADRMDQTIASLSIHGGGAVTGHLLRLVKIGDELRRCTSVDTVCRTAAELALKTVGASRAVLALKETERSTGGGPGTDDFVRRAEIGGGGGERVRISRTFVDRMVNKRVAVLARDTGLDLTLKASESIAAVGIRSIVCSPLWDGDEIRGYLYLDSTGGSKRFRPEDMELIAAIGYYAAAEVGRLRLMERIRSEKQRRTNLSRFLSTDVIRHIEEQSKKGDLDPTLSTQLQEVTILFTDIQGFTSLSERLDPADVKRFLDEYLDRMTEVLIDRFGGTLDKYIGDSIMALFGAPFSQGQKEDAVRAVSAAVAMRDAVDELRRDEPGFDKLAIRTGINTGKVIAGMLGSRRRLEYSVIGDAVNVASRLESTGEAGRIQIGETTYELVKDSFECEAAGERTLKNRAQPVRTWWVQRAKPR